MKKLFSLVNGDWMNTFKYDGDWITHSSQMYLREMLCKKSLQNQELLKELRLLKSDLDWMRSNTTIIQKTKNIKYLNKVKSLFIKTKNILDK
jgi:hypothetical protein